MHREVSLCAHISKTVISELVEMHNFIHRGNFKQVGFWAQKLRRNLKRYISTVSHTRTLWKFLLLILIFIISWNISCSFTQLFRCKWWPFIATWEGQIQVKNANTVLIIVPLTDSHRLLSRPLVTHHYVFILCYVLQHLGDTNKFQKGWNHYFNTWWRAVKKNPKVFPVMLTFARNKHFIENNRTKEFGVGLIHSWLLWRYLVQAHFLDILLYYCCQHLWATTKSGYSAYAASRPFFVTQLSTFAVLHRACMTS